MSNGRSLLFPAGHLFSASVTVKAMLRRPRQRLLSGSPTVEPGGGVAMSVTSPFSKVILPRTTPCLPSLIAKPADLL